MENIFEVIDGSGRKIRLTGRQWTHILKRHQDMINYQEEIKDALKNPQKITDHPYDKNARYYFKHIKNKKDNNYLLVIVKYLNGDGFVITAYFEKI